MKSICDALEVSRSNLYGTQKPHGKRHPIEHGSKVELNDRSLEERLKSIVKQRPSYGYRRATAVLNRSLLKEGLGKVNHKRVYRVMKQSGLLLPKYTGKKVIRRHEGHIHTLRSNTMWCSDALTFKCWDNQKIECAFVLDTCDREVISMVSKEGNLTSQDIQNLIIGAVERRFPNQLLPPRAIAWLTDNGSIFTATQTQRVATGLGLKPCQTPAYSPQSNGMSEAFVKRFKQDYVYVNELHDSNQVIKWIPEWIMDYNRNHPHKALNMLSPMEFRERISQL